MGTMSFEIFNFVHFLAVEHDQSEKSMLKEHDRAESENSQNLFPPDSEKFGFELLFRWLIADERKVISSALLSRLFFLHQSALNFETSKIDLVQQ